MQLAKLYFKDILMIWKNIHNINKEIDEYVNKTRGK